MSPPSKYIQDDVIDSSRVAYYCAVCGGRLWVIDVDVDIAGLCNDCHWRTRGIIRIPVPAAEWWGRGADDVILKIRKKI